MKKSRFVVVKNMNLITSRRIKSANTHTREIETCSNRVFASLLGDVRGAN